MKLSYDKETDSLVFTLRTAAIEDSQEIRPGVIADFDKSGALVSVEVLSASKKIDSLDELAYNSKLLKAS